MRWRPVCILAALALPTAAWADEYDNPEAPEASPSKAHDNTVYAMVSTLPLSVRGLENIHASDWQNFGLGPAEGRVSVPLAKGNTSGQAAGLKLGWEGTFGLLPSSVPLVAEMGMYFADMHAYSFATGVNLKPLQGRWGSVFLAPRVGYFGAVMSFGKVEVLPGKTPPVITPIGTFREGDDLSATTMGVLLDCTVGGEWKLTPEWSFRGEAGYHHASLSKFTVNAGDVELKMDAPALVKDDGSSTQAGLKPKASSQGFTASAGVAYSF